MVGGGRSPFGRYEGQEELFSKVAASPRLDPRSIKGVVALLSPSPSSARLGDPFAEGEPSDREFGRDHRRLRRAISRSHTGLWWHPVVDSERTRRAVLEVPIRCPQWPHVRTG